MLCSNVDLSYQQSFVNGEVTAYCWLAYI